MVRSFLSRTRPSVKTLLPGERFRLLRQGSEACLIGYLARAFAAPRNQHEPVCGAGSGRSDVK